MKYNIAVIILVIILLISYILDSFYTTFLGIILIGFIYLTLFLWEFSLFKKEFYNDIKFSSQRKPINLFGLCIACLYTLLYLINLDISEFEILMIICLWSVPIIEFIMSFIYKKKKPYTIFIKDNKILLNQRWFKMRTIPNLVQISYNRFTKNLILDFEKKSEVSIHTNEYNKEDIEKLLEILIEKSEHNVFIPNNLKLSKKSDL